MRTAFQQIRTLRQSIKQNTNPLPATMKAAIFDLDGTLVDSLGDIADASNYALTQLGYKPFTFEEYRILAGGGNRRLMTKVLKIRMNSEPDADIVHQAVALKMMYEDGPTGHQHSQAFPGAHDMLRTLTKNGIQVAVLSNKNESNVRQIVSKVYYDIPWKYVAGARGDTPLKPDPTAALRILNNHLPGVDASECAFVGDTDYDMKTAKSAGMVPIGVSWGNRKADDMYKFGAATVALQAGDIASFVIEKVKERTEPESYLKTAIKAM